MREEGPGGQTGAPHGPVGDAPLGWLGFQLTAAVGHVPGGRGWDPPRSWACALGPQATTCLRGDERAGRDN